MSDKKDPGTALVPTHIEPIDKALVPRVGHDRLTSVTKTKDEAQREFLKAGAATGASIGATIVAILISAALPFSSPLLVFTISIAVLGGMGALVGSGLSMHRFMKLVQANRLRELPPGRDRHLAEAEGAAHALIDAWNDRAERWNEGWDLLEREERDLFALHERCVTDKSRRGLIRRIEYVRKEKRKHLKVRAKLEVDRDRIIHGIETIRKRLPPPKEPHFLKAAEDGRENDDD